EPAVAERRREILDQVVVLHGPVVGRRGVGEWSRVVPDASADAAGGRTGRGAKADGRTRAAPALGDAGDDGQRDVVVELVLGILAERHVGRPRGETDGDLLQVLSLGRREGIQLLVGYAVDGVGRLHGVPVVAGAEGLADDVVDPTIRVAALEVRVTGCALEVVEDDGTQLTQVCQRWYIPSRGRSTCLHRGEAGASGVADYSLRERKAVAGPFLSRPYLPWLLGCSVIFALFTSFVSVLV